MSTTPSKLYESKLLTLAVAAGPPRVRYPLPQNCPIQFAAYAFDQEFEMLLSSFPPAQKNTPSNAAGPVFAGLLDGNAILTKLSQPSVTGGGRGKFTGSFCRVPASWDEIKTMGVNFPGWLDTGTSGRARGSLSRNVNVRLHYDYFVMDPSGLAAGVLDSGGTAIATVASMSAIAPNLRNTWLNQGGSYPIANSEAKDLCDGATVGTITYLPTYPTLTNYQTMIANAATVASGATPWTETAPPKMVVTETSPTSWTNNFSTAGQYRFADSSLRVYEGNIIERCSFYALMQ